MVAREGRTDQQNDPAENPDGAGVDAGAEENSDEFDADESEVMPDLDDGDEDLDDDGENIDVVVELSIKEQGARSLEIRRALEERNERKRLSEDLDYLDLDMDD